MEIDKRYKLKATNYIRSVTDKTQIVFGNSHNYGMDHITKTVLRDNGSYNKSPHFTIDQLGFVYQHFDTKYYSKYLDVEHDEKVISVALTNIGQLFAVNGKYYDIYNNPYVGEVFERSWKGCGLWQPYTKAQFDTASRLSEYLLKKHKIHKVVRPTNVTTPDMVDFKGVGYRSNHSAKHYDLSPAWEFEKFKKQIEDE